MPIIDMSQQNLIDWLNAKVKELRWPHDFFIQGRRVVSLETTPPKVDIILKDDNGWNVAMVCVRFFNSKITVMTDPNRDDKDNEEIRGFLVAIEPHLRKRLGLSEEIKFVLHDGDLNRSRHQLVGTSSHH